MCGDGQDAHDVNCSIVQLGKAGIGVHLYYTEVTNSIHINT